MNMWNIIVLAFLLSAPGAFIKRVRIDERNHPRQHATKQSTKSSAEQASAIMPAFLEEAATESKEGADNSLQHDAAEKSTESVVEQAQASADSRFPLRNRGIASGAQRIPARPSGGGAKSSCICRIGRTSVNVDCSQALGMEKNGAKCRRRRFLGILPAFMSPRPGRAEPTELSAGLDDIKIDVTDAWLAGLAVYAGLQTVGGLSGLVGLDVFGGQGITDLPIRDITEEVFRPGSNPRFKIQIQTNPYPDECPLTEKDLTRIDEINDKVFYFVPRFVYHIDYGAREALTNYYNTTITKSNLDILDICSSWVSHYPGNFKQKMNSIVGTGMNGGELAANKQLSSSVARNLNVEPKLPFPDSSFDVVTCVVSVDYLTSPLEVFREVNRVLKPGGRFIISQSNRCFPTKAVNIWLRIGEINRLRLIGSYFHFAGGFAEPKAFDISAEGPKANDPMYIVEATKL